MTARADGESSPPLVEPPWFALVRALVHDLRTPIATAAGYLELIELDQPELGSVHAEYLQRTAIALREISSLTTTLMEIARLESGQREVRAVAVDLEQLLARLLARRRPIERDAVVLLPVPLDSRLRCDLELVHHAFDCLLDLALARTPGGQQVEMSLESTPSDRIRFAVLDRGTPIDDERLAQLYDHRRSSATGASASRLALVYADLVATAHGGRAGAERSSEGGMRFWIELPREDGQRPPSDGSEPTSPPSAAER